MSVSNPQTQPGRLEQILLSPDENRLRAGWRLLAHLLLTILLAILIGSATGFVLVALDRTELFSNLLINQGIFLLSVTLSVILARRFIDRRSFVSLGLAWNRQAVADLAAGMVISALMMSFVFLVLWSFGWLQLGPPAWQEQPPAQVWSTVAVMFFVFVLVGWNEELLARGYWLQNMEAGLTPFWGALLSSILFALLHLGNPNLSAAGLAGLLLAGLFLAWTYLRTRLLWLAIGWHTGWNFFENTVFGFPVSGSDTPGLLNPMVSGPELITGGAFGPEAGLILIPTLLLGTGLIYAYTRRRA